MKITRFFISRFIGIKFKEVDGKKIKGIAADAFKGCVMVKRLRISEGIEVIENSAFKECKALEEVRLPDTLYTIGSKSSEYGIGAFFNTNLKTIIIPPNVKFIGPYSFSFCSNLRKAELSDKITTIHKSAFSFCRNLMEIKLPSSLLKIEENAFEDCSSMIKVFLPMGVQLIAKDAFKGTRMTEIHIPPTVTKMGEESTRSILGDSVFGFNSRNLTIYCVAGSVAMDYARKNNIKCAKAQF